MEEENKEDVIFKSIKEIEKDIDEGNIGINELLYRGMTLLHFAVFKKREDLVDLLLKKGADLEVKDEGLWTPLFYAVSMDYKDITEKLIENGADRNVVDDKGNNPLYYAYMKRIMLGSSNDEILKMLEN